MMLRIIKMLTLLCLWQCKEISAAAAKPTCGGSSSSKTTQLINPANPPRDCIYHMKAYSKHVCQLRIDFSMTLAQPTIPDSTNRLDKVTCTNDYFEVGGHRFCGTETYQHIYIPFNRSAGVKEVNVKIALAERGNGWSDLPAASWDMTVTQLECPAGASIRSSFIEPQAIGSTNDGFYVAPPGCLQYFPQDYGAFTSFNFNNGRGLYTGGLNYAICFRRTQNTAGLQLKAFSFKLGADTDPPHYWNLDSFCYPQVRSEYANEDYLMIPQATIEENGIRATYFCGESAANYNIKSQHPGPLSLIFNSDAYYKQYEMGFAFTYEILKT